MPRRKTAEAAPSTTVARGKCRGFRCGCERYEFARTIGGWRTCECGDSEQTHETEVPQ